jgi:predicted transcriptional regulator
MMNVGARLRAVREEMGISRPILARAAEMTEGHLYRLERGDIEIQLSTFLKIVRGLANITGRPPMEVLKYLLQGVLVETRAPAGGGR